MSFARAALRTVLPSSRTLPVRASLALRAAATTPIRPIQRSNMSTGVPPTSNFDVESQKQAQAGSAVPSGLSIRYADPSTYIDFSTLKGKNIVVTVPGAFTPACSDQVPGYIELHPAFQAKGVSQIYICSVNDLFVVNAWRDHLLGMAALQPSETVQFAADYRGEWAAAMGIVMDARKGLGSFRAQRTAAIIEDGKVVKLIVEPVSSTPDVTKAENVLKQL